jgi:predicted RNA-binding Zn-ribbon protein involved in translation (DUF1610 family)
MGGPKDSYEILGLAPGASPEEVKDAYIELAKVWRPDLLLDDDLLRRLAEQKMVEIDAAYDALKAFFRSNGYRRSMPERQNASEGSAQQSMVCGSPGCAGTIGANGECELCGKPLASGELRYAIYCPSCGVRHYLKTKKDYNRGICVQCGVPFRAPLQSHPATSRKMAYLVLLAVLTACVWFFFFSSEDANSPPRKYPVSIVLPLPVLSNNASETKDEPGEPHAPIISGQQQEAPSPVVSAPPQAIPLDAAAPAVAGSGDGSKKNVYQAGEVRPDSAKEKSNERYEELIDRVLRQKSMDSQKAAGDLSEVPPKNSIVEH